MGLEEVLGLWVGVVMQGLAVVRVAVAIAQMAVEAQAAMALPAVEEVIATPLVLPVVMAVAVAVAVPMVVVPAALRLFLRLAVGVVRVFMDKALMVLEAPLPGVAGVAGVVAHRGREHPAVLTVAVAVWVATNITITAVLDLLVGLQAEVAVAEVFVSSGLVVHAELQHSHQQTLALNFLD